MPSWLRAVLLAAGLLIGAAFAAEPVLAVRRRRAAARAARATAAAAARPRRRGAGPVPGAARAVAGRGVLGQQSRLRGPAAGGEARIVVAEY